MIINSTEPAEPTIYDLFPSRDDLESLMLDMDVPMLDALHSSYVALVGRLIEQGRDHVVRVIARRLCRISQVLQFRIAEDTEIPY